MMVAPQARWKGLKSTLHLDDLGLGWVGMKAQVQIGGNVQCADTERCGMPDIGEKKSPKKAGCQVPGTTCFLIQNF